MSFDSPNAPSGIVPYSVMIFHNGHREQKTQSDTRAPPGHTGLVCNSRPPNDDDTIETNDERVYFNFSVSAVLGRTFDPDRSRSSVVVNCFTLIRFNLACHRGARRADGQRLTVGRSTTTSQ